MIGYYGYFNMAMTNFCYKCQKPYYHSYASCPICESKDDDMPESVLLFVYGAYKRGFKKHYLLGSCVSLGKAITEPKYLLYESANGPVMVESVKGRCIEGELYLIKSKIIRKIIEQDGKWDWERKEIKLKAAETGLSFPNNQKKAIACLYKSGVNQFLDCGTSWPRT